MFQEIGVLYRGVVLGVMIAAPVGPIGLLCMRRTLQKGIPTGFATGFGAAFADALFAAVAALGVAAILDFMHHYEVVIRIIGGVFLVLVAWHTWHDKPTPAVEKAHLPGNFEVSQPGDAVWLGILKAFISGCIITLTNPLTAFGTFAVVATFGNLETRLDATTIVIGIFMGSTLWWLGLSGGVGLMRGFFTENRIVTINRGTAIILIIIAIWAIGSGARAYI